MTNGPDPVDAAIDEAARHMIAHAAPDLRARVAARLDRPAPRPIWWGPVLAAMGVAAIAFVLRPPAPPVEAPRPARADVSLAAPAAERPAAPPETAPRAPARRDRIDMNREPWPEAEETIEPLTLAALALDSIETVEEPLAPMTVAPLDVPPLAVHPLDEPDVERRR